MRTCVRWLLCVALVWPGPVLAKQDSVTQSKSARAKSKTEDPAVKLENWKALDDIKSGLEPQPPIEVQPDEQPDFVRELVRVQWRLADPIDLWIIRPKVTAKVPIVLYLYSYPTDSDQFRNDGWARRATAGGFAAVGFVSALTGQRYHNRAMKQWFVSELPESLGSSVHDVQLILNYLAARGDMDVSRVGMFGMGSGASIAILAAHVDKRIQVLDLLDPWGDWPDWLRDSPAVPQDERASYTTPEFLKSVQTLEPVTYLPSLKIQALRVQQTLSDPTTPASAKQRIAAGVPDPVSLVKYTNADDLRKAWEGNGLSGWIKQQLRPKENTTAPTAGLSARYADQPSN